MNPETTELSRSLHLNNRATLSASLRGSMPDEVWWTKEPTFTWPIQEKSRFVASISVRSALPD